MKMIPYIVVALSDIQSGDLPKTTADAAAINDIKGIVFGIVGAMALLMIVISGLRYITSGGDPQRAARAKDGIIYALVGLLLVIIADAIVSFVVNNL